MKKKSRFHLFLVFVALATSGYAEEEENPLDVPLTRFEVKYRAPKGVGYEDGYATAAFAFFPQLDSSLQPFVDLRGHIFNDGKNAVNVGACLRGPIEWQNSVWGVHLYYDYRESPKIFPHQGSLGFEFLSKHFDLRLDGYYPFRGKSDSDCPEFACFTCHDALAKQTANAALPNIALELGLPVGWVFSEVDLYFAIGGYYLFTRHVGKITLGDAFGAKARLAMKIYDGIEIGGDVTYDKIFDTRGQGWISLSVPLGPANMRKMGRRFTKRYPGELREKALEKARMTERVERFEIIPIEEKTDKFSLVERDCNVCRILFVNSCCPEGCGTFESPFATLQRAFECSVPGDLIYVLPGQGYLANELELKPNQKLIGSGTDFCLGCVCVPCCSAVNPTIAPEEFSEFLVSMTECNEVAGLRFDGAETLLQIIANSPQIARDNCFENSDAAVTILGTERGSSLSILRNRFSESINGIAFEETLSHSTVDIQDNCFIDLALGIELIPNAEINNSIVNICRNVFENIDTEGLFLQNIFDSRVNFLHNTVNNVFNGLLFNDNMNNDIIDISHNNFTLIGNQDVFFSDANTPIENSVVRALCNGFDQEFNIFTGDTSSCLELSGNRSPVYAITGGASLLQVQPPSEEQVRACNAGSFTFTNVVFQPCSLTP